ncbi:MAG: transcriptional regulator, DeoR family [Clostridia bacterium]|jgi:DeoR/GlpR family transcriptional regulator of sugar metabolism|nr:transcriptional regulator, DeoR family [Clostridia bacterium]
MKLNSRQNAILELLQVQKSGSVEELSQKLFFSPSTIRRDLDRLEEARLVRRTHGGVLLIEGRDAEIPLTVREKNNHTAKEIIAARASELINDGDSIIIDSSSTAFKMIPHLKNKKDLTIITNGAKAGVALGEMHKFNVYCTGGLLRQNSLSYVGTHARGTMEKFHVDKAFFSARCISLSHGVTDISDEEAELRRIMIDHASKSILLMDSSKIGNIALCSVCPLSDIDILITDFGPHINKAWQESDLYIIQA